MGYFGMMVCGSYAVLPMGQKILPLSRCLTKYFKWSVNRQKIGTKSENTAEEETNTIMLTLCNTLIDTFFRLNSSLVLKI